MPTEFHLQVQEILEAALQTRPEARAAFIQWACTGNTKLRDEVNSLLPHYAVMRDFEPQRPHGEQWQLPGTTTFAQAGEEAVALEAAELERTPPFCIDQYRVLEVLGRGGMGVVYRAVHATLRRPFAIKVLRTGLVSAEDRWRFAFEAQILRRLRHPGIAQIMHANEIKTDRGAQPYFVLEYILGDTLTRFAAESELDVRQRLSLFTRVCEPVEYAHRRGIIHRDLKPANILVEPTGQPKVLDFGIARLAEFESTPLCNERGRFIGTREYASPEQLRGRSEELTPRSDVFTLGMVLHELLTGHVPRRVDNKLRLRLSGLVLNDDAGRPVRGQREFHYYLTAIFRRALAGDPAKRYASAGGLGADIADLLAFFPASSGWSAFKQRVAGMLSRQTECRTSPTNRPLSAVLRKRIAMAIDAEDYRRSASEDAADSDDVPGED